MYRKNEPLHSWVVRDHSALMKVPYSEEQQVEISIFLYLSIYLLPCTVNDALSFLTFFSIIQ